MLKLTFCPIEAYFPSKLLPTGTILNGPVAVTYAVVAGTVVLEVSTVVDVVVEVRIVKVVSRGVVVVELTLCRGC